jgi:oligopeptide/dipeptide ABC transporter ATP-binding protein
MAAPNPLIEIAGLAKHFPLRSGLLRRQRHLLQAVDGIDLAIARGERVGLIGASGAGKSITGKLLARLIEPSAGAIVLHDRAQRIDATRLRGRDLKRYWRRVQILFAHAQDSLDPRYTILDTVVEPLHSLEESRNDEATIVRIGEMLEWVGLTPAQDFLFRYPAQLSDAQIQRVALARVLITRPALIVADDPFAQVDASLRAGLMRTLRRVLQHMQASLLYLTRDPATARYLCERIGVMLRGKIVEIGPAESVLQMPAHPYTQTWLSALSRVDLETTLPGDLPTRSLDRHARCRFYDHCRLALAICRDAPHPPLEERGAGHQVACYHQAI